MAWASWLHSLSSAVHHAINTGTLSACHCTSTIWRILMELTCRKCDVRPVYMSPNIVQLLDSVRLRCFVSFFNVSTLPISPLILRRENKESSVWPHVFHSRGTIYHICVDLLSLPGVTAEPGPGTLRRRANMAVEINRKAVYKKTAALPQVRVHHLASDVLLEVDFCKETF